MYKKKIEWSEVEEHFRDAVDYISNHEYVSDEGLENEIRKTVKHGQVVMYPAGATMVMKKRSKPVDYGDIKKIYENTYEIIDTDSYSHDSVDPLKYTCRDCSNRIWGEDIYLCKTVHTNIDGRPFVRSEYYCKEHCDVEDEPGVKDSIKEVKDNAEKMLSIL